MSRWFIILASLLLATGCLSPRKSTQTLHQAFAGVDAADAAIGEVVNATDVGSTNEDVAVEEDVEPKGEDADDALAHDAADTEDAAVILDAAPEIADSGGDVAIDIGKDAGIDAAVATDVDDGGDANDVALDVVQDSGPAKDSVIDTGIVVADVTADAGQDATADAGVAAGFTARASFSTMPSTPAGSGYTARRTGFSSAKACGGAYCAIGGWSP